MTKLSPNGKLIHRSHDGQTPIEIYDDGPTRAMHFGTVARQSAMLLHTPHSLILPYTRAMMCFLLFADEPKTILIAGLGGGSMPKFLLHHFPVCQVDVIECSNQVVKLAHVFFCLPECERLHIHVNDAANFMRVHRPNQRYDVILLDAFTAQGTPECVGQKDFIRSCATALKPDGIIACNLWSGRDTGYHKTIRLLKSHFDGNVLIFPVHRRGNVIALAAYREMDAHGSAVKRTAERLERELDLQFPSFLRSLHRPGGVWRRLFR